MWTRLFSLCVLTSALLAESAGAQAVATYWQDGACSALALGGDARLEWCVDTVVVTASGNLELNTSWTVYGLAQGTIDKGSDTGNRRMYLVDEHGNRYDHIETREAAAVGGQLSRDDPVLRGVYVFPPPRMRASEFTFRDDDQKLVVTGISSAEETRSDRALSARALGRVMQTEAIEIDYSWTGTSGQFEETYTLSAGAGGFQASGLRDRMYPIPLVNTSIPAADIESFLATLGEAPVLDRHYVPRVTRDDELPSITVTLTLSRDRIVFFSRSHGVGHAPWAVDSGGKTYVVPDDTPARALLLLDPFFGRDLATRGKNFLAPHIGEQRAAELWSELEEKLGTDEAYKTVFRLKDMLGSDSDDEVWAALERYIAEKTAPAVSPVTEDGDSTLVRAGRDGDVEMIHAMLRQGIDVNERSELDGYTALIGAGVGDHADAVRALLGAGADASSRSRAGETALTLAARSNSLASVNALLESGADVDVRGRDGKTPLMLAAENGHAEVVARLLEANADVNAKNLSGSTALAFAAENRHPAVVRALLGAGANPNIADSYRETPLMRTLHPDIARALIRAGADPNVTDDYGLTPAMRLSAGDGPRDPDGRGARIGGRANRAGTLEALLSAGANVNKQDLEGHTALIWATDSPQEHAELLPLLIGAGANVNVLDNKGGSALVYAAIHGHLESAQILIDAGADVNVRMGRTTALGFALELNHAELVTLLLKSGGRR